MTDRILRGSRLGATSYETDRDRDLAPRRFVAYDCPHGHKFRVPLSQEADAPATWECRTCGAIAIVADGTLPEAKAGKPARTHWDMLLERRTTDELEEVLAERLTVLREQRAAVSKKSA